MKIKTIAIICVFATIPLVQHAKIGLVESLAGITPDSPKGKCYNALTGDRCADYTTDQPLKAVLENFDLLYKTPTETLISFLNGGALEGPDRDIAEWILKDRGVSLEAPSTSEPAGLLALKDRLKAHNKEVYENKLDISSILQQETSEGFYQKLGSFVQDLNLWLDESLAKIWTDSNPSLAPSSSAPAPVEVPVQPTNPYLGKTPDALLDMSDADPSLKNNPLFIEALNKVLGGEEPQPETSAIKSLSETFPLSCVLQKPCAFNELKSSLEILSLDYSTKDQWSIPALNDFLQRNGLTAIKTLGFGNCAFDAVLLTWFCREGLYNPKWNITLGTYLESQIAWFREEIANLLPEGKKLGQETRDTIRVKNQYVSDAVFTLIAQYLETEIIVIATDKTAQCCLGNGEISASITPDETEQLIKDHPSALIVCHNGANHFLATRPLLPEEHQK